MMFSGESWGEIKERKKLDRLSLRMAHHFTIRPTDFSHSFLILPPVTPPTALHLNAQILTSLGIEVNLTPSGSTRSSKKVLITSSFKLLYLSVKFCV